MMLPRESRKAWKLGMAQDTDIYWVSTVCQALYILWLNIYYTSVSKVLALLTKEETDSS